MKWVGLFLYFFIISQADGQVVLQLEKFNQVKTYKYLPGSSLFVKTKDFPDTWRYMEITKILPEQNTVFLDDLITPVNNILSIKHENNTVRAVSQKLYQFGFTWLVFAGGLKLLDRYEFGRDTYLVPAAAFASGFAIKTLFFRKTFTIGKNSRVRILDLNIY